MTKLTASDAADDDYFGDSVAISGDTVVVGAYGKTARAADRGAAYVFERNQGGADNWGQVKKLTASDAADDDYFGYSVAISGDTVVVGAYREDGAGAATAGRPTSLAPTAANGRRSPSPAPPTPRTMTTLAYSVAISGDTVVVGADWGRRRGQRPRGGLRL